jgi:hypothetical protein
MADWHVTAVDAIDGEIGQMSIMVAAGFIQTHRINMASK